MGRIAGIRACVFDAYGTLFDVGSASARCQAVPQAMRAPLSAVWREKQLQYAWLRTLQGRYADFWRVTGEALDFALDACGLDPAGVRDALMDLYLNLKAFPDAGAALSRLREAGLKTAILSNGSPAMLASAISSARLEGLFDAVLSVDAVGAFKTDPRCYRYAVETLGLRPQAIGFVSSNGWDAYAAADFGLRAIWCNRAGQPPERLPGTPACEIKSLEELAGLVV